MSGITFEPLVWSWQGGVAICLVALAIKLMDDVLDLPADREFNRPNWARHLGRASTPYCLALFALAVGADAALAVSLFCAAYAWGMTGEWRRRLPSGLPAYAEGLLMMGFSAWVFGIVPALWAVTTVGAVEYLDRWVDGEQPGGTGFFLMIAAMAITAMALAPALALVAFAAGAVIIWLLSPPSAPTGRNLEGQSPL